jgi:NaMN:DMB phosphoribosyltransferase
MNHARISRPQRRRSADVCGKHLGPHSPWGPRARRTACCSGGRTPPIVVLDGLATSVSALLAVRMQPIAATYLIAGQRSRERAHGLVLAELGLEPLLDLRLRAGEGVGAALAVGLLRNALSMREQVVRTIPLV